MKLHYYSDTDSLYIDLADRPSTESVEVRPGVVIDMDAQGRVVGIDLDHASGWIELPTEGELAVPFHRAGGR
jgi:uncharacterized protein YuzE